jgi:hypothetical protein
MKNTLLGSLIAVLALAGCVSSSNTTRKSAVQSGEVSVGPLLEKQFVLDVVQHIYRWHFDQSYILEADKLDTLEVWARPLHPVLDAEDRSEFAEFWIPAVNMRVEMKRSDYKVPEMNLDIVDRSFKVKGVARQPHPPAPRSNYQVASFARTEVRDHLFATRTNRVALNENLRLTARKLIAEYLSKAHPAPFTEDQVLHIAPISPVCNDLWTFWETGRKIMLFSADMDLSNPGFSQLSQLRMEVIDLDKDVVTSTKEVPGSNAFVTKDWVGRLFFNCILYGERVVRTADEMNRLLAELAPKPAP